jgi:hypothetical protein
LLSGLGFSEIAAKVHEWVNKIGIQILEQIVEGADKAFMDSEGRKRHWQIVRKDTRGILTSMGQVNISRNKASGMSYSRAGRSNRHAEVSRQTVMKCIRDDAYHRNKYVRKAAGGDEIQMRRLPDALRAGDKAATAKELKACCEKAENEGHRERVLEVKKYLYDN